jgi:parvulin-like peptidyl-prolyl isomerase
MKFIFPMIFLASALHAQAPADKSKAAATDPTVATVNGIEIKKSEYDKTFHENMLFVSDKKVTPEKVIYDIVNRELGVMKAKSAGLQNDPIVKKKMEEVLYHAQISKDLEGELAKITVSDSEVKKYYENNKEFRTAHILTRLRAIPSIAEAKEGLKQALQVYEELKLDPTKFSSLANKYSQSSTAPTGGDLGYQPAIRLAPEYYEAIKDKKIGEIVPPVRTQFGYHIIKVLAVKDVKNIDKDAYKKIVYDTKRNEILDKYFEGLRKGADIKINYDLIK